MAFSLDTLKPLYKLVMGESGASNAFLIALRLGLEKSIIEDAHEISYEEKKDYTGVVENMIKKQNKEIKKLEIVEEVKEHVFTRENKVKTMALHNFEVGDLVYIPMLKAQGVVVELEDRKGNITVMIKKKKTKINYKRIKKYIDKKDLYPENYDMDIVTKSIDHRKKNKQISKGNGKNVVIEHSQLT